MSDEKLVDLRHGYPERQCFRTLQVFECDICKALTNLAWRPFKGVPRVHAFCPLAEEKWHYIIREKMEWLGERAHHATYAKALRKEIKKLKKGARKKARNNLAGDPDLTQCRPVVKTGGSLRIFTDPSKFRLF